MSLLTQAGSMEAHRTYADAAFDLAAANDRPRVDLRPTPITPAANREIQMRLGRAIRQRRRMVDLTLQDVAAACGVTFQQVHKYESGLCSMSASQLWCIAVALSVPVSYFYDALAAADLVTAEDSPLD